MPRLTVAIRYRDEEEIESLWGTEAGVDVGGEGEIEGVITELAGKGVAILMISSEMEELIRSCDRIAVLSDGRKVGELTASEISEEKMMHLMAHGTSLQGGVRE